MQKKVRSARFAILFLLTLAAASTLVFFAFSSYQRKMAAQRRDDSRANLETIDRAIRLYSKQNGGAFPEHASRLTRDYLPNRGTFVNAAWPEQPGYIYIPGSIAANSTGAIILVHENVPERKRKLGIQVLFLDGRIGLLTEREFVDKLNAQESAWKSSGRVWSPEALVRQEE